MNPALSLSLSSNFSVLGSYIFLVFVWENLPSVALFYLSVLFLCRDLANSSSFWVTLISDFAFNSSVYGLFLLMSLAIGVVSSSKNMGFDGNKDGNKEVDKSNKAGTITKPEGNDDETRGKIEREMSESSLCATEDEDENESDVEGNIELGPQFTIKEQLEKDKVCFFKFVGMKMLLCVLKCLILMGFV